MSYTPYIHESVEQTNLFRWAAYEQGKYPELKLMYHIPNGGSRNRLEAANLKKQGGRTRYLFTRCTRSISRLIHRNESGTQQGFRKSKAMVKRFKRTRVLRRTLLRLERRFGGYNELS